MDLTRGADREALARTSAACTPAAGAGGPGSWPASPGRWRCSGRPARGRSWRSPRPGAGVIPDVEVVEVPAAATTTATEELRALDPLVRNLPPRRGRPDRGLRPRPRGHRGDQPLRHRPADPRSGRDRRATGRVRRPRGQDVRRGAVGGRRDPARPEPRRTRHPRGAGRRQRRAGPEVVWSGDAREGFNGGGNFVRWVRSAEERAAALEFFAGHCDRVRVLPFLEGCRAPSTGSCCRTAPRCSGPSRSRSSVAGSPQLHLRRPVDVLGPALGDRHEMREPWHAGWASACAQRRATWARSGSTVS